MERFCMNFNLSFLNKLKNKEKKILQSENNFYRGAIPWFLLCSEKKKIIYISTSNRNLENYYAMLENYYEMSEKQKDILMEKSKTGKKNSKENENKLEDKKIIDIFENISQNKEDITGINIRLLDILKNQEKFILFVNLQITLDIFFEKVKFFSFKTWKEYSF